MSIDAAPGLVRHPGVRLPPGVETVGTRDALGGIARRDCAAVIWDRPTPLACLPWIDALAPDALPRTRVILTPDGVRGAVEHACDTAGMPDGPERDAFVADVTSLSELFAGLMRAPYLRLRLDVVTTNACRRFHVDAITARLICTYRGAGTQLGVLEDGCDPRPVQSVPTGAPIVLRGTLWPEHPLSGLLHRSPPIEGTGETRLMLVLDPVTDPEDEV